MGTKAAIGFLKDISFIKETLQDADAFYCRIPPNYHKEPDILKYYESLGENYTQAIQETGVKRVVHLSSFGAHLHEGTGIIVGSHQVEEKIKPNT